VLRHKSDLAQNSRIKTHLLWVSWGVLTCRRSHQGGEWLTAAPLHCNKNMGATRVFRRRTAHAVRPQNHPVAPPAHLN
jgi:hypothetical protein